MGNLQAGAGGVGQGNSVADPHAGALVDHQQADRRRLGPRARPVEKRGAQLVFKPRKALREGRLRDAQLLGGLHKTSVPMDRDDLPHMPNVHPASVYSL